MLSQTIETPAQILSALRTIRATPPSNSRCEVLALEGSTLQCLICDSPVIRAGLPTVLAAVVSAGERERKALVQSIEDLTQKTGLRVPRVYRSSQDDITIMMAPWAFRGEFRALVDSAIAHGAEIPPSRMGDLNFASTLGPCGGHEIDEELFRRSLFQFVLAADTPWQGLLRKLAKGNEKRSWMMPIGCSIQEVITKSGAAYWDMQFDDLENLERAMGLVELRLDSGKASSLHIAGIETNVEALTHVPSIRLLCRGNTREGRVQMARLIQYVLKSLDAMNFKTRLGSSALASVLVS